MRRKKKEKKGDFNKGNKAFLGKSLILKQLIRLTATVFLSVCSDLSEIV